MLHLWFIRTNAKSRREGIDLYILFFTADIPWFKFRGRVQNVIIAEGVTNIGAFSFYDCEGLVNIYIPDSVTHIGERGFIYCESLSSIHIPDGVTFIGVHAFDGCSNLREIGLPVKLKDYNPTDQRLKSIPTFLTVLREHALLAC